jgi:hypothetical protein
MYSNLKPSIIKSSIEYYDSFQEKINSLLNKTEYIEFIDNNNITDQIVLYDKNKKEIFKSSYECLSFYSPSIKTWKWSWGIPMLSKKYTYITRKLIDYAISLDSFDDIFIKTTLVNSKINVVNDIQLDIIISLFSKLSKKPFILEYPHIPHAYSSSHNLIPYKEIMNKKKNYNDVLIEYLIILDFE